MYRSNQYSMLGFAVAFCISAQANGHILSSSQACERLKVVIAKNYSAPRGSAEYRCNYDSSAGAVHYYVFALRSNFPAPLGAGPKWVGSALVGWYAVSKTDGTVFNWDIANFKVGSMVPSSMGTK
jgi:hypothetical protein